MKLQAHGKVFGLTEPAVLRVTAGTDLEIAEKKKHALIYSPLRGQQDINDYGAAICFDKSADQGRIPIVSNIQNLSYLGEGDVILIRPDGFVRVLYRRNSKHNFILMTIQCNSFCLMCSQPPQLIDDAERLQEHLKLIELIDPATEQIGITGGEPTLFKDGFLKVIEHCKQFLPSTRLHVLSNGRMFYYRRFTEELGQLAHPGLTLGIPLYSDIDSEHDYIVQAKGAFDETVTGFHHLAEFGVQIEIRVVLHRPTVRRLPQLAEFIARNFPFASHVALMGLEMFGFVHRNFDELWIDPVTYQAELQEAVAILNSGGLSVSIYNHQLCLLERDLWAFARQSISDWKNIYLPVCSECDVRGDCGGLFESATKKHSSFIQPVHLEGF